MPSTPQTIHRLICAALATTGVIALSGCGEQIAEQVVERGIEQAGEGGEEVDIDFGDDDEQTVTVTDEDGNTGTAVVGSDELPDGFPEELIPDDATVNQVMTMDQDGQTQQMVMFSSDTPPGDLYDHYVELIPSLGYEVTEENKVDLNGMVQFSVNGVGNGEEIGVMGLPADEKTNGTAMRLLDGPAE